MRAGRLAIAPRTLVRGADRQVRGAGPPGPGSGPRLLRPITADGDRDRRKRGDRGEEATGELRLAIASRGSRAPFGQRYAVRDVALFVAEGLREVRLRGHRRFPFLEPPADALPLSPDGGRAKRRRNADLTRAESARRGARL